MKKINGKYYPILSKLVKEKNKYIGQVLEDHGDLMHIHSYQNHKTTIIEDITLNPFEKDRAYFEIRGRDFSCGFDTLYGRIKPDEELTFCTEKGQIFKIYITRIKNAAVKH